MTPETRTMHSFQTPDPIRLNVHLPKGRIMVVAEETTETRVELTAIHGDAAGMHQTFAAHDWIDRNRSFAASGQLHHARIILVGDV